MADSRVREGTAGAVITEPLPPAQDRGAVLGVDRPIYDSVLSVLPHAPQEPSRRHRAPQPPAPTGSRT